MLQSLASHLRGQELTRGNTIFLSSIRLVSARECVESNALVFRLELAVKSIVDVQSSAEIDSEDVNVQRVNVEIDIVHALLQTGNVTQMSVEIVGLVVAMVH